MTKWSAAYAALGITGTSTDGPEKGPGFVFKREVTSGCVESRNQSEKQMTTDYTDCTGKTKHSSAKSVV